MQARYFEPWCEKLAAWASDEQALELICTGFTRFTRAGMAEAWKGEAPSHPALQAMEGLEEQLKSLANP